MAPSSKDLLRNAVSLSTASKEFVKGVQSYLMRDAVPAITTEDVTGTDLARLAENYIGTIRDRNLLDAVARYAIPIPNDQYRVLVASGTVAGEAAESAPKAVTTANLSADDMDQRKVIALLVVTSELLKSGDSAWQRLLRRELETALINSSNEVLLNAIGSTSIPGTGDPLDDLAAGLAAADDSLGYVVAAAPGVVRQLALTSEGRMGIRGGQYVADLFILPVTGVDNMIVIPASKAAIQMEPIRVRNASHADVLLADDPSMPGQMTSLFQTNSRALAVERRFRIKADSQAIEVLGES